MELVSRLNYDITKKTKDNCPFCILVDKKNIIWKWKYFFIIHNKYPYLWLNTHLLVVPYKHRIMTSELSKKEYWELKEVEKFMENFYSWLDYFSFIRQSNFDDSRSVEHLHYHYLPWKIYPHDVEHFLSKQFKK